MYLEMYGTQATTTEADDRTPPKDQTSFPPDMMPYCVDIQMGFGNR